MCPKVGVARQHNILNLSIVKHVWLSMQSTLIQCSWQFACTCHVATVHVLNLVARSTHARMHTHICPDPTTTAE